ncbi:hypothetical protein SALBM311S_05778 [Streptomyces alboniger]
MSHSIVHVWEEDPGAYPSHRMPIGRRARNHEISPLGFEIREDPPENYHSHRYTLRYWTASDSLIRATDWISRISIPKQPSWHSSINGKLPVTLDAGDGLGGQYTRGETYDGLFFYQSPSGHQTIYACESPDIVCHEVGHAILDGLRPDLIETNLLEQKSFHEAFGDISSMMSSLTIDSFCSAVIHETRGQVNYSSRLSRMAEQLSSEMRRRLPGRADTACVRETSNEFFYVNPERLPIRAPATQVCHEPHSFSRIFSAAFLDALAGMFARTERSVPDLQKAATSLAQVLCQAVLKAPNSPRFWADLAARMIAADLRDFNGEHEDILGVRRSASSIK